MISQRYIIGATVAWKRKESITYISPCTLYRHTVPKIALPHLFAYKIGKCKKLLDEVLNIDPKRLTIFYVEKLCQDIIKLSIDALYYFEGFLSDIIQGRLHEISIALREKLDQICEHIEDVEIIGLLRSILIILNSVEHALSLIRFNEIEYMIMDSTIRIIDNSVDPTLLIEAAKSCDLELIAELAIRIIIVSVAYFRNTSYGELLKKIKDKLNNARNYLLSEYEKALNDSQVAIKEALKYIEAYIRFIDEIFNGEKSYLNIESIESPENIIEAEEISNKCFKEYVVPVHFNKDNKVASHA